MQESLKRAFVCPKCGIRGSAYRACFCSKCKIDMTPVPYRIPQWDRLPSTDKSQAIEQWMNSGEWPDITGVEKEGTPPASIPYEEFVSQMTQKAPSSSFAALIIGIIVFILGIASTIYGNNLNNDFEAQLSSLFGSGQRNPGNIYMILGIVCAVIGVILVVFWFVKKERTTPQEKV